MSIQEFFCRFNRVFGAGWVDCWDTIGTRITRKDGYKNHHVGPPNARGQGEGDEILRSLRSLRMTYPGDEEGAPGRGNTVCQGIIN